jgi:hypothetical protein
MEHTMTMQRYEIDMVGLGIMGRNLVLTMADHGHSVVGYDKDAGKTDALRIGTASRDIPGTVMLKEFVGLLRLPCAVKTLTSALFRLPGDLVLLRTGVILGRRAAAMAWQFRTESADMTTNKLTNGKG